MKVLVTGSDGYVGSELVRALDMAKFEILAVDSGWFGSHVTSTSTITKKVMRFSELKTSDLEEVEFVIHLANIANDPMAELNPELSWNINTVDFIALIEKAIEANVKHFIYASSGSVYGVKNEEKVTEDLNCQPLSTYNKTKMVAERILTSYSNEISSTIVRPATVCGISKRMRFDVVVNMFCWQAFKNKKITVLGGTQIRPHIHIEDMVRLYIEILRRPSDFRGIYNAGFENMSLKALAEITSDYFKVPIEYQESNDPRSYRLDSSKLLATGFSPKYNVINAVESIAVKLASGQLIEDDTCHSVKWLTANWEKFGLEENVARR